MCLHIEKDEKYIVKEQVYVILYGKEMEICRNMVLSFKNTLCVWYIYSKYPIYVCIYPK